MVPVQASVVPCLWMDSAAEEAALFYTKVFPEGRITAVARYPEGVALPSAKIPGSVLTVEFEIAGQRFVALNGGPIFAPNPSISFFVYVPTAQAVDALHGSLVQGGKDLMPLGTYPWSERYAWVQDRYGCSWQLMVGRPSVGAATVVPCLMFSGPQAGQASAAMAHYAALRPGGQVLSTEHYRPEEGPESYVKHGRFVAAGAEMVAMDSPIAHAFNFNEGLSLQVMCRNPEELDAIWAHLAQGGREGSCGWVTDRFGVCWQVVPEVMGQWMTAHGVEAQRRVFQAMLPMKKLDWARLVKALAG